MDTSRASTHFNAGLAIYREVVRLFEVERIGCVLLRHATAAPTFPAERRAARARRGHPAPRVPYCQLSTLSCPI